MGDVHARMLTLSEQLINRFEERIVILRAQVAHDHPLPAPHHLGEGQELRLRRPEPRVVFQTGAKPKGVIEGVIKQGLHAPDGLRARGRIAANARQGPQRPMAHKEREVRAQGQRIKLRQQRCQGRYLGARAVLTEGDGGHPHGQKVFKGRRFLGVAVAVGVDKAWGHHAPRGVKAPGRFKGRGPGFRDGVDTPVLKPQRPGARWRPRAIDELTTVDFPIHGGPLWRGAAAEERPQQAQKPQGAQAPSPQVHQRGPWPSSILMTVPVTASDAGLTR